LAPSRETQTRKGSIKPILATLKEWSQAKRKPIQRLPPRPNAAFVTSLHRAAIGTLFLIGGFGLVMLAPFAPVSRSANPAAGTPVASRQTDMEWRLQAR
jgi:hypothetical protein